MTGDKTKIYQHYLETKRQSSLCVFFGKAPLLNVKSSNGVGEKMVATFLSTSGYVAVVVLLNRIAVGAQCYTTVYHPTGLKKIQKRPGAGLVLGNLAATRQCIDRLCQHDTQPP